MTTTSFDQMKDTLAQIRMAEFLEQFKSEAPEHTEWSKETIKAKFEALFPRIYRYIYQDTQDVDKVSSLANSKEYAVRRREVRKAISDFVDTLFDENGKPKSIDKNERSSELSLDYTKLYRRIGSNALFGDDTRRVLDTMVTAISQMRAEQEVHELAIDFRRLNNSDKDVLEEFWARVKTGEVGDYTSSLEKVFENALNKNADTSLQNTPAIKNGDTLKNHGYDQPFPSFPDKRVLIEGIPFLSHKRGDEDFLVTVKGGLVPMEDAKEKIHQQLIVEGKMVSELFFKPENDLEMGNHNLRGKDVVDGFDCRNGEPLLCLDVNLLTGLRPSNQQQFEEFYKPLLPDLIKKHIAEDKQEEAKAKSWRILANDEIANALREAAGDNSHLRNITDIACKHIKRISAQLEAETKAQVAGKNAAEEGNRLLTIAMGGAGSGKSGAKEMMANATGDNFVTASLDDFRASSDVYHVLKAANHHADDYGVVEKFANTMRDMVTDRALEEKMNLRFDGTSIPFDRFDKSGLLKKAKAKGYQIIVTAYDTQLAEPIAQKGSIQKAAYERVIERFNDPKERRSLPWSVVTGKHIKTMPSILDAFGRDEVDRLMVFCKDGLPGKDYLVAEAFTLPEEQQPPSEKPDENLFSKIRADAKTIPQAMTSALNAAISNIPSYVNGQDNNMSYLTRKDGDKTRIMLVHNNLRFTQMAERALMNPYASTPKGLVHKPHAMAADTSPASDMVAGALTPPANVILTQALSGAHEAMNTVLSVVKLPSEYLNKVTEVLFNTQQEQEVSTPA